MARITEKTKIIRLKTTPYKKIGEGALVLNLDNGNYFQINETGLFILEFLETAKSIKALIEELASQFKAEEKELTQDTMKFLKLLLKFRLAEVRKN